ncbi:MAG TPA: hypothetical protein VHM69_13890 [Rubrobacter sp.]|nr:hypothetical protein [Rubrobacter sp.]
MLPINSVGGAGVTVSPFGRNATAAFETLGWLLLAAAGALQRKLVVYPEG